MTEGNDDLLKAYNPAGLAVLRVLACATGHGDDLRAYLIARSWRLNARHPWGRA